MGKCEGVCVMVDMGKLTSKARSIVLCSPERCTMQEEIVI